MEYVSNGENLDSNYEDGVSLFGQFPSPFFEDIPQNHQQRITTSAAAKEPPPSPPPSTKTKRVRKKRSAGKTDRHSKIHTAQGLRDRRMRLSLHIARKFFGLQDMLGFDKASKTIEWLFCKSKKAIDEVADSIKPLSTIQSVGEGCESLVSDCEVDSGIEFDAGHSNKGKQPKVHDEIKDGDNATKPNESDLLARELRGKARARARERTRERMKSKLLFGANPNDDYDHQQLGFSANPNNNNNNNNNPYTEGSSSSPLEYSGKHQVFDPTHLNINIANQETDQDYLGSSSSTYFSGYDYNKNLENPPAGWLNSSNTFLGFLGGWDCENFTENYGIFPNLATSTAGDHIHGQSNYSSVLIPHPSHFQNHHQRD